MSVDDLFFIFELKLNLFSSKMTRILLFKNFDKKIKSTLDIFFLFNCLVFKFNPLKMLFEGTSSNFFLFYCDHINISTFLSSMSHHHFFVASCSIVRIFISRFSYIYYRIINAIDARQ